jgi:AcrR family transcriptional regulator
VKKRASKRVRRSPEEAEKLIKAAAEALISEKGPDAVGLKQVAARAGVSHALVTHYFGTYENLVRTVLLERVEAARMLALQQATLATPGPEALLDVLRAMVGDATHVRLMTWAFLSSRNASLVPMAQGELSLVVDAVVERRKQAFGAKAGTREDAEFYVALAVAAAYGFALGKETFARAMNRPAFADEEFFVRLANLLRRSGG